MQNEINAALYARVSTEDQAMKGISIEAQIDFLQNWAEKEGYHIFDVFKDEGYSGKDTNRPEWTRLMDAANNHLFNVLLIYHNDRLSRNTEDALRVVRQLKELGIAVRCSNINVDISTPEGKMFFTQLSSFATYFREDAGRKTSFGMQKLKKEGFWIGRKPDLFESKREKHTTIIPTEQIDRILELRKKGLSLRKIAELEKVNHIKIWRVLRIHKMLLSR